MFAKSIGFSSRFHLTKKRLYFFLKKGGMHLINLPTKFNILLSLKRVYLQGENFIHLRTYGFYQTMSRIRLVDRRQEHCSSTNLFFSSRMLLNNTRIQTYQDGRFRPVRFHQLVICLDCFISFICSGTCASQNQKNLGIFFF